MNIQDMVPAQHYDRDRAAIDRLNGEPVLDLQCHINTVAYIARQYTDKEK